MARSATRTPTAAPLPDWVAPQLTQLVETAPDGDNWLHEIKYDGYRMHARLDRGAVKLLTRTGLDWTHKYPAIAKSVSALDARQAYLDGELCGVGPGGITSFNIVQLASDSDNAAALVFFLFDLLHLDGEDLRPRPVIERKERLGTLLANTAPSLHFSDHVVGQGPAFYEKACTMHVEGIVSKRTDAPYTPGNRGLWRKVKCLNRAEFVVVGWSAGFVAARLLRSGRKADLCRPCGQRHRQRRARAAVAALAAACDGQDAARCRAAARQPFRIAPGSQPRALGAARAGRRGKVPDLDRGQSAAAGGL
jgi:bifunctional non-homologous end joining protein LigD